MANQSSILYVGYSSLHSALADLPPNELIRIPVEVDPKLEMAEIHRRVHDAGGPAILFERVKGSPFRAASNIYGTKERTAYLFRRELEAVQRLIRLKADPADLLRAPGNTWAHPSRPFMGFPGRRDSTNPFSSAKQPWTNFRKS